MPGALARLVTRPRSPAEFETEAGPFLSLREAENNLILGLVSGLKAGRSFGPLPPFFAVVYEEGRITGVAMHTPPLMLILAAGTEQSAIPRILDALEAETNDLGGIHGPSALAPIAVSEWSRRHGIKARISMRQRIYKLERVKSPRPTRGKMRVAGPQDLELIATWFQAFVRESQPDHDDSLDHARESARYWINSGGLRVWEDGRPVSMAGAGGRTPNGIRVSAVYTPSNERRKGYASALVATLSQELLDSGLRFCFLYTDVTNPTSNKIYQDIGYEAVTEAEDWAFEGPDRAGH